MIGAPLPEWVGTVFLVAALPVFLVLIVRDIFRGDR